MSVLFSAGQKVSFKIHGPWGLLETSEATVRSVSQHRALVLVSLEEHPTLDFDGHTGKEIQPAIPGFWSEIVPIAEAEASRG